MEYIQTKPSYNQGYYQNGTNYIMEERGGTYCIIDNNSYSNHLENNEPKKQMMQKNNNIRKSCINTYPSKQLLHQEHQEEPPTIDFDDILNADDSLCHDEEETIIVNIPEEKVDIHDEKSCFDLEEEHILPPCFDTLINADNQMLASPDLDILKLDLNNSTPSPEGTDSDIINNNHDLTFDRCLEIENDILPPSPPKTAFGRKNEVTLTSSSVSGDCSRKDSNSSCPKKEPVRNNSDKSYPSISEKEIQRIKEANKSLDCILSDKKEEIEEANVIQEENDLHFDPSLFEPLQQVPCLEDINLSTRPTYNNHPSPQTPPQINYNNQPVHYQNSDRVLAYYHDDPHNNYDRDLSNNYNNHNNINTNSNDSFTSYDNSYCSNNYNNNDLRAEINSRNLNNEYINREVSHDFVSRELCGDYSTNPRNYHCGNEYIKGYYIKNESPPSMIHNGAFYVKTEENPASFYNMIEEQVRHQKQKRENEAKVSRKILERYLPAEQDLIKRYIEGDKCHLPIPPVNMEIQEIIRRERKKHKNRVAASKCRKKKLEREAQLEVRVNYLKERSVELNTIVRELRNQATALKQRIMEHINAGCTLNPNILSGGETAPYYR